MTKANVVKQPMIFSTKEMESRKQAAKQRYLQGYYESFPSGYSEYRHPASYSVFSNSFEQFLALVVDAAAAGHTIYPHKPAIQSPTFFECSFYKDNATQEADLAVIYKDVEATYREEIEAWNTAQISLLAEQLYNQEQAKAQKAAEEAERHARDAALKEAQEYFSTIKK